MTTPANPAPEPETPITEAAKVGAEWIMASHSSGDFVRAEIAEKLETELADTRRRLAEAQEGEKWAGSMFCEIMATAVSGLADAVIVAQQKMNAGHTLKAVQMLRDHANDQKAKLTALRNAADEVARSLEQYTGACGNTGYSTLRETFQSLYEKGQTKLKAYSALIAEGAGKATACEPPVAQ